MAIKSTFAKKVTIEYAISMHQMKIMIFSNKGSTWESVTDTSLFKVAKLADFLSNLGFVIIMGDFLGG